MIERKGKAAMPTRTNEHVNWKREEKFKPDQVVRHEPGTPKLTKQSFRATEIAENEVSGPKNEAKTVKSVLTPAKLITEIIFFG